MEICKMKKLTDLLKESYGWERKFGEKLPTLDSVQKKYEKKLNEEIIEVERVQDMEASIFDVIIEFKKTFEKSEWKKNRKISSLIKKMIDLESKLGNEVTELE